MQASHYLRFVQALVLAAAVPACATDPVTPESKEDTETAQDDAPEAQRPSGSEAPAKDEAPAEPVAEAPADAAAEDAGVDAALPFSSGPIVPPELPAHLA